MHTHKDTYIHACKHACTYQFTHARKHARTQARTHTRTHAHSLADRSLGSRLRLPHRPPALMCGRLSNPKLDLRLLAG